MTIATSSYSSVTKVLYTLLASLISWCKITCIRDQQWGKVPSDQEQLVLDTAAAALVQKVISHLDLDKVAGQLEGFPRQDTEDNQTEGNQSEVELHKLLNQDKEEMHLS